VGILQQTGGRAERLKRCLINYTDTKAKCRHLKKIYLKRDFGAGVYQSLKTGDIVSNVGIFDPALSTVAPLTFSLVTSPPFPLPCVNKYTVYMYTACKGGGSGRVGERAYDR
jgi:hypothetical protein